MKRRIRVAACPHCKNTVPLDRKAPEENSCALTICQCCFAVFENSEVESHLIPLEELCQK